MSVDSYYEDFVKDPSKEEDIIAKAVENLTGKEVTILKKRITNKKEKGKGKSMGSSFVDVAEASDAKEDVKITERDVDEFWAELEKMDPSTLISEDVIKAFQYVGFNPDIVVKEVLARGIKAGKSKEEIKKDIVEMIMMAVIKGSITDNNLKKTSDEGKVFYKRFQDVYKISSGGGKGKGSDHLTISRLAAAMPGTVIQILLKRPEFAKTFVGPFSSKSLPTYLRHQAAAACIPESCPTRLRDYLLGLITAYTADQSKVISKTKDTAEELYDNQMNYIVTTNSSKHPSESQRQKIFKGFGLSNDFDKMNSVAIKIKKVKMDFLTLTQAELDEDLSKATT